MKCFKYYFFCAFIFSLLFPTLLEAQTRADEIRTQIMSGDKSSILVVAHRGNWRYASENSMLAIQNAIAIGVDIVEIDIQRTKDKHLILMHDETIDRTTTGKGRVDELTLDSLKNVRLRNGIGIRTSEKISTLEEVLKTTKGQVILNIDKADRYIDDVYRLLKKTGTQKYVIIKTDKPFADARVQFHNYLTWNTILMPIIDLDSNYAEREVDTFLGFMRPKIIEFVYEKETNPKPKEMKNRLTGKTLLWYNTMWDTLAGGHDDDMALHDADSAYGYLIDSLGATIIQTDRPEYLLKYLRKRHLHQ